jgi:hypothetical protein
MTEAELIQILAPDGLSKPYLNNNQGRIWVKNRAAIDTFS